MGLRKIVASLLGYGVGGQSALNTRSGRATGTQHIGSFGVSQMLGFRVHAYPGTYNTYRIMLANPTLALCWSCIRSMLLAADWSVESDDDVPDEVVKAVERTFVARKGAIVAHAATSLNYGNVAFEKEWVPVIDAGAARFDLKLRPLLADLSNPIIDSETGDVVGVNNRGVELGPEKSWWYAYDAEPGNPFGRSRLENVRDSAWKSWRDTFAKRAQYTSKSAGVVPIVRSPLGSSADRDGAVQENQKLAEDILRNLPTCQGLVYPNVWSAWAEQLVKAGVPAAMLAWSIDFLKVDPGHGAEFNEMLKADETLLVRGYFGPERSIVEGQFGTKAEAEAHGDFAVIAREQELAAIVEALNRDCVDDYLDANWGPGMKGKARIVAGPLSDAERAFFRAFIRDLLLDPAALEVATRIVDLDAILDGSGVPKAKEIVEGPGLPDPNAPQPQPTEPALLQQQTAIGLSRLFHRFLTEAQKGNGVH